MNLAAFNELVGVVDEAIDLAARAVETAESAIAKSAATPAKPAAPVVLVKVASDRFRKTAKALIQTGTFEAYTPEGLAKTLESAGPADFLDIMEKLASRAVFPLDVKMTPEGDLVEKSATTLSSSGPKAGESKTDRWVRACEESGISIPGR